MRPNLLKIAGVGFYVALMAVALGASLYQPSQPTLYKGFAFVAGQPAPDGLQIFARVRDFQSPAATVTDGKYGFGFDPLVVGPATSFVGGTITFHATFAFVEVQAAETDIFSGNLNAGKTLDLNFPELPVIEEPTPTPTSTATATPPATTVTTPTATPVATPTPTPSLPIPGEPGVTVIPKVALSVGGLLLAAGVVTLVLLRRRKAY